jgi:hypothetical protein
MVSALILLFRKQRENKKLREKSEAGVVRYGNEEVVHRPIEARYEMDWQTRPQELQSAKPQELPPTTAHAP